MNVFYLFPTELEAKAFRELSPRSEVVISGVGMVATATTVARLVRSGDITSEDVVVLAGIAGTYGDSVAVGSVVEVVEECCAELPERFQERYRIAPRTSLRPVVSNTVHGKDVAQGVAEIENMEGAALFALAQEYGFGVAEIRAISNRVGEAFACWHVREAVEALAHELSNLKFE